MEEVKQFVMECAIPTVKAVNPVDEEHMPVGNDEHSYLRVNSFAEIINDFWTKKIVNCHFVEDNENYPLICCVCEFY